VDIISPCVTFNDHEGSTKSYEFTRQHYHPVIHADFVPPSKEIKAKYEEGEAMPVKLHDGTQIVLRKVGKGYDPTDRGAIFHYLDEHQKAGEIVTGLLYVDEAPPDLHAVNNLSSTPLASLSNDQLCPGNAALQKLQARFR
jgi:2-oxoglutarate ferredoxin oxidoreductase subunit beta